MERWEQQPSGGHLGECWERYERYLWCVEVDGGRRAGGGTVGRYLIGHSGQASFLAVVVPSFYGGTRRGD